MLEDLLEKNVIKLLECKRLEEMRRTNDPKYCIYHRVVSHPVEKCFVLKNLILSLAKEGKILLDLDETTEANHATFAVGSPISTKSPTPMEVRSTLPSTSRAYCKHIQFGTLEPMHMSCFNPQDDDKADDELVGDEEGWTFVTYKKLRKPRNPKPHVPYKKRELQASNSKVTPKGKGTNGLKKQRKGSRPNELLQKEGPLPITLHEFFPKSFFAEGLMATTYMVSYHDADDREDPTEKEERVDLEEIKTTKEEGSETHASEEAVALCAHCCDKMTFADEDLLLGSKPHNRPLFVSGYTRGEKVSRILIDDGSAVNIMPKGTMRRLGISMEELSKSRLVIQGFNQEGQRAIGMIRLDVTIDELKARPLFHVIDSKTSYNLLLGRPWIHGNGVVPSTLHQCFKYCDGKQVKVVTVDLQPFTVAESHFADAKFYLDCDMTYDVPQEESTEKKKAKRKEGGEPLMEGPKPNSEVRQKFCEEKKEAPMVLRYVPASKRKEGQSPFGLTMETKDKCKKSIQEDDVSILKSDFTLPLPKLDQVASTKPPLKGFTRAMSNLVEEDSLPIRRTEEGFDPKAYKLLAKSGYDSKILRNWGNFTQITWKRSLMGLT